MALSTDHDDAVLDARQKLTKARAALADTLDTLASESKAAAKAARGKARAVPLDRVYAAMRDVERAEEVVDFAAIDVASASGHDI